jgi:hypothetical protein
MSWRASIWAEARRNPAPLLLWALAGALIAYVFATGGYLSAVLHFAAIYVIFVTGLNIFMGYAGQVSFGHNCRDQRLHIRRAHSQRGSHCRQRPSAFPARSLAR